VDTKLLARIGAIVFVAIAITMTAIQMRDTPKVSADPEVVFIDEPDTNPLRSELARCSGIGEVGASDPACLRAWAENRRRFLTPGARPNERMPAPSSPAPPSNADGSLPSGSVEPLGNDSAPIPNLASSQKSKGAR
jgi:conjugative transfer region protein TrbK